MLAQAVNGPLNSSTVGAAMDLLSETVKNNTVVGYVQKGVEGLDGRWYCSFAVDSGSYPIVPMLIKSGALGGLSLTHYHEKPKLTPLEISLCLRPARPECMIKMIGNQEVQEEYLRALITKSTSTPPTMADNAAAPTTTMTDNEKLEEFINNMPEDGQKLVKAKFGDFLKHIENERNRVKNEAERAETAEFKLNEANAATAEAEKRANNAQVNLDLFDSTIRMVGSHT